MSNSREEFERNFPEAVGVSFNEGLKMYDPSVYGSPYNGKLNAIWQGWQAARPKFTALCHSKTKQIGSPVGYLVQNEAGALAAVHNLGRVTWLDDCVAGPVEKAARAQDGGEPVGVVNKSRAGEYEFFPGPALPAMENGMHKVYAAAQQPSTTVPMAGEMVSIDVSTCDEDNGNRVFGEIIDWQDDGNGERIWLCSFDHYNYQLPTSASVPEWFNPHSNPPAHYQPVVGYHPEWIDSSNHAGVRECFTTGYGDVWLNSAWLEGADSYQTGKMVPLLWTHMPTPSKQEVIGDE